MIFFSPVQLQNSCFVIREVYENGSAWEYFENQLDYALESKVKTIAIEPTKLGKETAKWISLGNWLQRASVFSGIGCLICGTCWPDVGIAFLPFGFTSVICAGVYGVSWQTDPCCKYQVERDIRKLQKLPMWNVTSSDPVVLVRRNDMPRFLYATLAIASLGLCTWRLYNWYLFWSRPVICLYRAIQYNRLFSIYPCFVLCNFQCNLNEQDDLICNFG